MVALPTSTPPLVTAEAPRERVSGSDVQQQGDYLANGLKQAGSGLEDLAVPIAQQSGKDAVAKATSRDENGNLQVDTAQTGSFILGRAGNAYAGAVQAGTDALGQVQTTADINKIRQTANGDPDAFKTSAASYLASAQEKWAGQPGGNAMIANAASMIEQHQNSLINQKAAIDVKNSYANITALITQTKNDLGAMARGGATDTKDYDHKSDQLNDLYDDLQSNENFETPKDVVDGYRKDTSEYLMGQAVVGRMDKSTQGPGGVVGAYKELHDAADQIQNPALRNQLISQGESRLSYLQSQNQSDIAINQANIKTLAGQVGDPRAVVPDGQFEIYRNQALKIGDPDSVRRIEALKMTYDQRQREAGLSPSQVVKQNFPQGAPGAANISRAILGQESGGNPNAPNSVDGARGMGQIMPDTFKQYAKPGESIDNPADNLAVHQRIIADYYQRYSGDAARVAVAYFSGPGNVAPSGSATPYIRDAADGNGKTTSSYVSDVQKRINGASINGTPFTQQQLQSNPWLLSTYVQSQAGDAAAQRSAASALGDAIEKSFSNNIRPAPETVASYVQLTEGKSEFDAQRQKIMVAAQANIESDHALSMSPAEGQAYMGSIKAAAQGGSLFQADLAEHAQSAYTKARAALASDPAGTAVAQGWVKNPPAPLDFSSPQSAAAALGSRSAIATAIGSREQNASQSAVFPQEVDQVKAVMAGPLDQRMNLLGAVATLPEQQRAATLQKLAQTGEAGKVFSYAGGISPVAPQVAQDIVQGRAALEAEPSLAPKKADDWTIALNKYLPVNSFNPNTRDMISSATESYYAKLSKDKNDVTGIFDSKRFDAALEATTGGTAKFNTASIIGPWYGAKQNGLDSALRVLTNDDLKGAVGNEGHAVDVSLLKPSFFPRDGNLKLMNVGDLGAGKYFIYSGDPANPNYIYDSVKGGKFQLDLGSKRQAADAVKTNPSAPWKPVAPGFVLDRFSSGE